MWNIPKTALERPKRIDISSSLIEKNVDPSWGLPLRGLGSSSNAWVIASSIEKRSSEYESQSRCCFRRTKTSRSHQCDHRGPREGEVLVEIKASGVCHTDAYTFSDADPEGLLLAIRGHADAGGGR